MAFGRGWLVKGLTPFVEGSVNIQGKSERLIFLVDTGSNFCSLPKDVLVKMGHHLPDGISEVSTGNGIKQQADYSNVEFFFPIWTLTKNNLDLISERFLGEVSDWDKPFGVIGMDAISKSKIQNLVFDHKDSLFKMCRFL